MAGGTQGSGRTNYQVPDEMRRMAEEKGAVGMIFLRTTREAQMRPWARAVARAGEPSMTWIGKDGTPFSPAPNVRFRATFDTPAAEALFAGAPRRLAQILAEDEEASESGEDRSEEPARQN